MTMLSTYTDTPISSVAQISNNVTSTTCYYIRKLLAQHKNELKSLVACGAAITADEKSDLNHVLESLYLEDLEICLMARELEVLAQLHRSLSTQTMSSMSISGQLVEVERRIFWILGLKKA
ncbi:MAG: hypothetical protein HC934_05050 [Acaryochloridaceae cyanobacterium SU_2_1]|nr:hypothetical protein [Acaryochloridaceae cyanobacterium SU_2_1]NJM95645.1 hypothetical protein [Acaryochloridaceae cyanobacterium CSU_5_19]